MSADFWAGYISGAAGILIGNPLDLVKVRLQATGATTTSRAAALAVPDTASSVVSPPPGAGPQAGSTAAVATPPQTQTSRAAAPASTSTATPATASQPFARLRALATGTAAPVLGYGALNALLFVSYNRTETLLNSVLLNNGGNGPPGPGGSSSSLPLPPQGSNLWTTWLAGAAGGLATWVVSTPTELVKCRAQLSSRHSSSSLSPSASASASGLSSWAVAKQIWRSGGVRGFYFGGAVTALRDSVGYGFYFWSYELCSRWMEAQSLQRQGHGRGESSSSSSSSLMALVVSSEAARVLLCGGVAGVVTWASIFPLDTIKTRMQAQPPPPADNMGWEGRRAKAGSAERRPLLPSSSSSTIPTLSASSPSASAAAGIATAAGSSSSSQAGLRYVEEGEAAAGTKSKGGGQRRLGAIEIAREAYREGGIRVFFRGLTVCSIRAFIVNAAQWAAYEWIMRELGQGREQRSSFSSAAAIELI